MKINWDTTFSTFYWEMFYTQGHASGWGYSKADGHPEAADKLRTLCRCINMLFTKGYIAEKCSRIEIYQRQGAIIRKDQDRIIITLYPASFDMIPAYVNPEIKKFLDEIYTAIATGQMPEGKILPNRKIKNRSNDEIYSVSKNTQYANYDMFFKALQYLKSIGIEQGQLDGFYYTVKKAQPWLFQFEKAITQVTNFLNPVKEKSFIPANEFYKGLHNKEDLQAAGKRLQETYDLKNLPPGETIKSLLQKELQKAQNNINQQK